MFYAVLGFVVLALLTMVGVDFAFDLMSSPSDAAVAAGVAILLVIAIVWHAAYVRGRRRFYPKRPKVEVEIIPPERKPPNSHVAGSIILFLVLAGGSMLSTGCSRIGPGHVGIKVNYAGTGRGVQDYRIR